jgi:hypothetical protein
MVSLQFSSASDNPLAGPDEMRLLIADLDYLVAPVPIERIEKFSFSLNDMPFTVIREKNGEDHHIRITGILGYLPFTAESAKKRATLLQILAACHSLFNVKFGLDKQGRIVATGLCSTDTMVAPDFLFYPLIQFLQEARPFIELIGRHF